MTIRCIELDPLAAHTVRRGECSVCGAGLSEGPHGGLSVNWICPRCGRTFNVHPEPMGVHLIVEASPPSWRLQ